MSVESFLSNQLRKFSLVDFGSSLDWWFYLTLSIVCAFPLYIHITSQAGNLWQKAHAYLETNNPSNQVLLFLSLFFLALMTGSLMPILATGSWWIYVSIIVALAIKPLTKTWFW
jgi:hypothetical protein